MDALEQGIVLEQQGRYHEAVFYLRQAVQEHQDSYEGWMGLSKAFLGIERYSQAGMSAENAIRIRPHDARAWCMKARALEQQPELAIEAYEQAIGYDPRFITAYVGKGVMREAQHDYQEALDAYDHALRLAPPSIELLYCKCRVLIIIEEYDRALTVTGRMIALAPESGTGWYARALTLFMQQEHLTAEQAVNKALGISPGNTNALVLKANIIDEMGRRSEARTLMEQALVLDPDNEVAHKIKQEMDRALSNNILLMIFVTLETLIRDGLVVCRGVLKTVFRPS